MKSYEMTRMNRKQWEEKNETENVSLSGADGILSKRREKSRGRNKGMMNQNEFF